MPSPPPSQVAFLPLDLQRWDRDPGGDMLVVPVWTDVRPLRGATGLLDWRLCGKLSQMAQQGRITGAMGEKLLLVTKRVRWGRVLAVGAGESSSFGLESFRTVVACALTALRGLGAGSFAIALPGRDVDRIRPDQAVRDFLSSVDYDQADQGVWVKRLTIIDPHPATKLGGGWTRSPLTGNGAISAGARADFG